jgi:hypothetical protein
LIKSHHLSHLPKSPSIFIKFSSGNLSYQLLFRPNIVFSLLYTNNPNYKFIYNTLHVSSLLQIVYNTKASLKVKRACPSDCEAVDGDWRPPAKAVALATAGRQLASVIL